ncbi:MAG TPA: hypothetical protein VH107_16770 [Lacipirellulaceae bacterium]|nr:hypothetical protein [Lacipirellulaceae bacterium]
MLFSCGLVLQIPAEAATRYWRNAIASGNWSAASDWSNTSAAGAGTTDGGVPAAGDLVRIENSDGVSHTVTLDVTTPTLGLLTINQSAMGSTVNTVSITSNVSLNPGALLIGGFANGAATTGRGAVAQSAGTVTMGTGGDLVVGYGAGAVGTYTLSGTGALVATQSEFIGFNGNGTFTQSGGTNTVNSGSVGYFNVGFQAGSIGGYNLNGGQLTVNKSEIIGDVGTGVFTQTGGTNIVNNLNSMFLGNSSGGNGTYTAEGTASLSVGGDMNVGYAATGAGTLNVQDTADVEITGALNIGAGDQVNLSSGTLGFNGYSRNASGVFNFTGGTVFLRNDRSMSSDLTILEFFPGLNIANGRNLTIGGIATIGSTVTVSNAAFDANSGLYVGATGHFNGVFNLQNGATSKDFGVSLGHDTSTTGVANISGIGTTWNTINIFVGDSGQGTLSITGGATVNSNDAYIGFANNSIVSTATVSGAGTTWNSFDLNIGNGSSGRANTLTVTNNGVVNVQTSLTISPNCKLILNGGTVHFDSLQNTGTLEFDAGTIDLTGSHTIGGSDAVINQYYGISPILGAGKGLTIDATATISTGFTLNGGKLTATNIVANGPLQFSGGVLELTGGTITGISNLGIPTNGEFRARGTQAFRVNGAADSTITATGTLSIGDSTLVNGFSTQGTLAVGANSVTVLDSNDAVFDSSSLVTIGSGATAGSLTAANGLTLDFGGNITGFGPVTTPNNVAKPTIVNGHVAGTNSTQQITMSGYVKGVGTFDNVTFAGTFSPGFSPTTSYVGNVGFASSNTLVMEIGGTTAGSQYDRLVSSGQLALGGTLQLALISGFTPAAGQSFNLFDWQSIVGAFGSLSLPVLDSGLTWDTSQLYSTGVVSVVGGGGLPGDFNLDGKVDAADYVAWRKGVLVASTTANYNLWRANFSAHAGSGSLEGAAVPEPACGVLLIAAVGCLPMGRSRRLRFRFGRRHR